MSDKTEAVLPEAIEAKLNSMSLGHVKEMTESIIKAVEEKEKGRLEALGAFGRMREKHPLKTDIGLGVGLGVVGFAGVTIVKKLKGSYEDAAADSSGGARVAAFASSGGFRTLGQRR